MKQLKPRDKITQKMTRDGAVEINETQQTAERISSREADSDFSQPDTATAERVMEHLDAAHTRKASKRQSRKHRKRLFCVLPLHACSLPTRNGKRQNCNPTSKNRKKQRQTGRSKGSSPEAEETCKRAHL